jgi:hypothetical protein
MVTKIQLSNWKELDTKKRGYTPRYFERAAARL